MKMRINELQKMSIEIISKYNKKHDSEHKRETAFPHLVEEVGELAKEINHHISDWRQKPNHNNLSEEMADVLIQLLILADDYKVDLEDAFLKKIKKLKKRFEIK